MCIQAGLVFGNKGTKRFGVAVLGAVDEVFFVKGSGQGVFTSVNFSSASMYTPGRNAE